MSGSLNRAILIGNLGQDPEIRATPSGELLARFSLATTERWKNAQGEKQEKTEWHNCTAWGKLVGIIDMYVRKGSSVYVEGKIEYRKYTDDKGVEKTATSIRVSNLVMLGGKGDGSEKPATAPDGYEDDLPL